MPEVHQRSEIDIAGPASPLDSRPVVLATLSVRIDPRAERMAIDSALETRARLIVANMLWIPPYPATLMLAREYATLPHEEDLDAVRQAAGRAAARGVPTELWRVSSRRPLSALVELIHECGAVLVVLGPDVRRTSRPARWVASRRLLRWSDCLMWIAPDG
jgi:hypothetical protein